MDSPKLSRRGLLAAAAAAPILASARPAPAAGKAEPAPAQPQIRFCLNTSTIRGQKLSVEQEVEIAAKAGYSGIEPWVPKLAQFEKAGGSLRDLGKRIADRGLRVESAIGFANWIVDDPKRRAKALDDAKRDMQIVRTIGGRRIAAPPAGATRQSGLDLFQAAARYADLLKVGAELGVTPQLELWGFSKTLSRLGELLLVAAETGRRDACVLPDVYHIYKGGSDFAGLKLLHGQAIHAFHMNDYPDDPPRATIRDAHRVYPGDGVAPLRQIIRDLHAGGFRGAFSLELFNPEYWKQDPLQVAKTGLEKMQAAVRTALA